jgi:translation initiation factor 1
MSEQKKLTSLADLEQLLPESMRNRPVVPDAPKKKEHDGKGVKVRVYLDTKGRKGKAVTMVVGLRHNPDTMEDIARFLKQHCGAGGTVKDGAVEIQGDQRVRAAEKLRAMNYEIQK